MGSDRGTVGGIDRILQRIFSRRGFDIRGYKMPNLQRRISRRMDTLSIPTLAEYADHLEANPDEYEALLNTILVNVTQFFRDPKAWDFVREKLLPEIIDKNDEIRIWSAGCSSGEEAYSIAITLAELTNLDLDKNRVRIYATDIDETALKMARSGTYNADQMGGVSEDIREKYFTKHGDAYIIAKNIREMLIFSRHNLISDPPMPHINFLLCRNVLIYFDRLLQSRVIPKLHYSMEMNGYLWLGKAESLVTDIHGLKPLNNNWRMFKKTASDIYPQFDSPSQADKYTKVELMDINSKLDQIVQNIRLGFIMLDSDLRVIMCNKVVQEIWNLLPEKITGKSFLNLEISYRPVNLKSRIEQAIESNEPSVVHNAEYWINKDDQIYLRMEVFPTGSGVIIFVEDVTAQYEHSRELQVINQALEVANEKLLAENEELRDANRKFQSINEELQCTNEEMEAANAELKASNEELNARIEELSTMKHYMKWI